MSHQAVLYFKTICITTFYGVSIHLSENYKDEKIWEFSTTAKTFMDYIKFPHYIYFLDFILFSLFPQSQWTVFPSKGVLETLN